MKIAGVAVMVACLAFSGCASHPTHRTPVATPPTGDERTSSCARVHTELAANYFESAT
jgi:hypothetical protein